MGPGQQVQGSCDVLEGHRVACAPEAGQPGAGPPRLGPEWQRQPGRESCALSRWFSTGTRGTTLGLWVRRRTGDCRTSQGGVGAWGTGQEGLQGLQQLGAILPFSLEPAEDRAPQEVCSCDPARGAKACLPGSGWGGGRQQGVPQPDAQTYLLRGLLAPAPPGLSLPQRVLTTQQNEDSWLQGSRTKGLSPTSSDTWAAPRGTWPQWMGCHGHTGHLEQDGGWGELWTHTPPFP